MRFAPISTSTGARPPTFAGAGLGDLATWRTWTTVLKAAFGRPLDDGERTVFRLVAGDRDSPERRVRELWAVAGRRSGKSRMAAAVAICLALFQKHRLASGEKAMALVLASSVEQARLVFSYVRGFLEANPRYWRARSRRSSVTRSSCATASPSPCIRTAIGLFAAAPWLLPSSTKPPSGATRVPRR